MSLWPKPILHPNKPLCDAPNMIVMKPCGVCGQSYHCFDIAMTSYMPTYISFVLSWPTLKNPQQVQSLQSKIAPLLVV
jgi:hypothetical protein